MSKFEVKRINNILCGLENDYQLDDRGLGRFIFDKFLEYNEKTFQINAVTGEEDTYGFVNKKCVRLAMEMKKRGVLRGDVVLICSSNNMDSIVPLIGTLYVNAITVTLDPTISLRDTTHLLKLVSPKMIFVEDSSIALIESALKGSNFLTQIIVMGFHEKYPTYAEFVQFKQGEEEFVPNTVGNITDIAVIFFSSGTTGLPKGIKLSHQSLIYANKIISDAYTKYEDSMVFTTFYWGSALIITILTITNGGRRVVIKNFQPEIALPCIEKYEVKNIFLAPGLTYRITDELVSKYPCPKLKNITLGGSAVSNEQMKKIRNYFPHCDVYLGYAQTEAGGLVSIFSPQYYADKYKEKATSSGFPITNIKIKIVDVDTEEVLGPNQKGEIRISTPSACSGYYNQESNIFDKDDYIKTGDLGYYDDDNCLYVCDRIKDMFKYQSWHIVPLSLENVIGQHPSVGEIIVIGIPSEEDGHIPMALVVLRQGTTDVSEEDLLQFANERLPEREQLRAGLKIVKHLPKGVTGKVVRKQITDLVVTGQIEKLML